MKTIDELAGWVNGAAEQFSDPADVVGQVFAHWNNDLSLLTGDLIECGHLDGKLSLKLGPGAVIPLEIAAQPELDPIWGTLQKFGASEICTGVWSLSPSLCIRGMLDVFIVLYDVPASVRWEQKSILIARA